MQSFPKSLCCTFNRDLVQPPGDRAWRMGEKMIKQEWILLKRVRHFSQSLIMFRPDWRWNCIWREEKLPPLGQSRGTCINLISSCVWRRCVVWLDFWVWLFCWRFLYAFNLISQEAVWKWERQTFDCDVMPAQCLVLTYPVSHCFPPSLPSINLCAKVAKMPATSLPHSSGDSYFFFFFLHLSNPINF